MKTKLTFFLILPFFFILSALAGSASWNLNPTNGDWNTAANWMPSTVPNGPSDVATFGASNVTAISPSADTTVDGVVFNPGASAFTITSPGKTLTFSGQGVTNNSGSVQNFATETAQPKVGTILFLNEATAGDSSVYTVSGTNSLIMFSGDSDAGNATLVVEGGIPGNENGSVIEFDGNSTAGNAAILGKAGASFIRFFGSSTAGTASIIVEGPSEELFNGGFCIFSGSASADHSTITLGGSPGSGADFAGDVAFLDTSDAGDAVITANGATGDGGAGGIVFCSGRGASLANAMIVANGTDFQDATGGQIVLAGAPDNGDATLIIKGGQTAGGQCIFSRPSEGRARAEVFGNGTIVIDEVVTLGSIEGDGVISVGSVAGGLTTGSNNLSATFSGLIQDGTRAGSIEKIGTGTLTLSGSNTYTGGTTVTSGILLVSNVSGSATGTGAVSVNTGTLGGSGIIAGAVTFGTNSGTGAFLAPSKGVKKPATLAIQGALTLNDDSTCLYKLDTKRAKADEVIANGVVIDSGAKFSLRPSGTIALTTGQVFTVISNTSASPIAGTFHNLRDGQIISVNGSNLQAGYTGGDGNDLVLTVVP